MISLRKIEVNTSKINLFFEISVWSMTITCYVSSSIRLACSLRCVVPACCIQHSLDKQTF